MADDDKTAARDFVMARAAAASGSIAAAKSAIDEFNMLCVVPDEDPTGKKRRALLVQVDDWLGEAACAVQLAREEFSDVDPTEGEPEDDEDEELDDLTDEQIDDEIAADAEEEEEEEEPPAEEAPPRPRRRR